MSDMNRLAWTNRTCLRDKVGEGPVPVRDPSGLAPSKKFIDVSTARELIKPGAVDQAVSTVVMVGIAVAVAGVATILLWREL